MVAPRDAHGAGRGAGAPEEDGKGAQSSKRGARAWAVGAPLRRASAADWAAHKAARTICRRRSSASAWLAACDVSCASVRCRRIASRSSRLRSVSWSRARARVSSASRRFCWSCNTRSCMCTAGAARRARRARMRELPRTAREAQRRARRAHRRPSLHRRFDLRLVVAPPALSLLPFARVRLALHGRAHCRHRAQLARALDVEFLRVEPLNDARDGELLRDLAILPPAALACLPRALRIARAAREG